MKTIKKIKTIKRKSYKRAAVIFFMLALGIGALAGCGKKKEPVTLTMWHVYGAQTDSPLNAMIDEFNRTVGKDKGITVQVTQVSNTNKIHEAVLAAAKAEPGAAPLPDIFISYPKTVLSMPDTDVLVDFSDYFSEKELEAFVPEFVEEGYIQDKLLVFPLAKSTEIFFVDKTLFDRFAAETGMGVECFSTWERLFELAVKYYEWTDAQTPDVPNDGKCFFVHDYHFNYLQVGTKSLGAEFFSEGRVIDSVQLNHVWMPFAKAAIAGGIWLQDTYATEPLRTGDAITSVASSASVLYYEDIVTYPDNVSEPIEVVAYPVPVFADGEKWVMQRGAGVCVTKSSKAREEAAVTFLKWLTESENNVRFVTQAGYMPVTREGFALLPKALESLTNNKYRSLYEAFISTQEDYHFYTAPQFSSYLSLESDTEKITRRLLREAREEYLEEISRWTDADGAQAEQRKEALLAELAEKARKKWLEQLR